MLEKTQKPEALVLDLDGVIYPFNDAYIAASRAALERRLNRLGLMKIFNDVTKLSRHHVSMHGLHQHDEAAPRIINILEEARMGLSPSFVKPDPLLKLSLKKLQLPVYVVSQSQRSWVDGVLDKADLCSVIPPSHRFAAMTDLRGSKLEADTYKNFLKRTGYDGSQVMMLDDNFYNLMAANRAGLRTVLISAAVKNHHDVEHVSSSAGVFLADLVQATKPRFLTDFLRPL